MVLRVTDHPGRSEGAEQSANHVSAGHLSHVAGSSRGEDTLVEQVEWIDVEAGVRRLVHVWTQDGDVAWMMDAWERLAANGWAEYDGSGLERTRVLARLLALGHLYWDFTYAAFDLGTDIVAGMADALDDLSVVPLFVGQLAGPEVIAEDPGGSRVLPWHAESCRFASAPS